METNNFRTLVIANPQSAGGTLGRRWSQVSSVIAGSFGPFSHRFTRGPGDATRVAREALQSGDYEMIVAMGGDGTISEVVDGFFDDDQAVAPEVALGVLHFGTGGDFRRTIKVSKVLAKGAEQLAGRETRQVDVGRLSYVDNGGQRRVRHFLNIASFGMSGLVDRYVNEGSKLLGGRLSFGLATLKAMRRFSPQRVRLTLDDRAPREVELQTVAVANGQYFGGGMRFAPDAKIDDGLFDVVVLGPTKLAELLLKGHRVYSGRHVEMPHVSVARARRVVAEPLGGQPILLDVDGETPGTLPASFDLLPGMLRLKKPRVLA